MIIRELYAKLGIQTDQSSVARASLVFTELTSKLTLIIGAAKQAQAFFKSLTDEVAAHAKEVSRASKLTGVDTTALQELQQAAEMSGVSTDDLTQGLIKLSRKAYEASTSGGSAAKDFAALGVKLTKANGELKPANELFEDMSEKFSKMPEGMKKTALSLEFFSRSGANLLPLLNKGKKGIADYANEARDFGALLDNKTFKAAQELSKATKVLNLAFTGLRYSVGGALLKNMGEAKLKLAEWIKANRELIGQKVKEFVGALVGSLSALKSGVAWVIDGIKQLAERFGTLPVAIGVATVALTLFKDRLLSKTNIWIMLGTAIMLALDDIHAFSTGGKSFIGDLTKAVDKLWNELAEADGGKWSEKHPVKAFLLSLLHTITHLRESWDGFVEAVFGKKPPAPTGAALEKNRSEANSEWGARRTRIGLIGAGEELSFKEKLNVLAGTPGWGGAIPGYEKMSWIQRAKVAFGSPNSSDAWSKDWFPGGAAPGAATPPANKNVIINNNVGDINVKAETNANPDEIAGAMRTQIEDVLDTRNREAAAALAY